MSGPTHASRPASAFEDLDTIRARLSGGPVLVALDFDGTLTEIEADPGAPVLTARRRAILSRLPAPDRWLAIVSGRALADLRRRVGLPQTIYVGNHGLEIEGPGIERHPPEGVAERLARLLEAVADRLEGPGVLIEDKTWTATLHVRPRGDARRLSAVEARLRDLVEAAGFVLRPGHASWEIRPSDAFDKGDALRHVIDAVPGASAERVLYVGDDVTDEDAFRALPAAVTARVGDGDVETAARYRLAGPVEVYQMLEALFAG
ncbi:MAG TPA: trehalose-phosphatase [Gemmatimonadota bacterium]|nr:trehalose-phosphatase [Gemmatimonadota bacterium]